MRHGARKNANNHSPFEIRFEYQSRKISFACNIFCITDPLWEKSTIFCHYYTVWTGPPLDNFYINPFSSNDFGS